MVGKSIQDIVPNYSEHTFVFLNRSLNNENSVDLTDRQEVLTYFEKNNFPNVFKTEQDCIDNAVARTYEASDCRLLATDNDNQEWWLGEPDYGTGINKIDEVKDLMQQTGGVIDLDGNTLDRYKVGNSERDPMGWFVARCRNGDC